MQINLTKTQYKVLLRALSELESSESDDGCNDVFAGDKLLLLSKPERKAAKTPQQAAAGTQRRTFRRVEP